MFNIFRPLYQRALPASNTGGNRGADLATVGPAVPSPVVRLPANLYKLYGVLHQYSRVASDPTYADSMPVFKADVLRYVQEGIASGLWSQADQRQLIGYIQTGTAIEQLPPDQSVTREPLPSQEPEQPQENPPKSEFSDLANAIVDCLASLDCPVTLVGELETSRFHTVYVLPVRPSSGKRISASTILSPKFRADLVLYGGLPDESLHIYNEPGRVAFQLEKPDWSPTTHAILLEDSISAKRTPLDRPLHVPFGKDLSHNLQWLNFSNSSTPHALVVGGSGSGKTSLQTTLVQAAMTWHPPENLRILLIDVKGSLGIFNGLPWLWRGYPVISDISQIEQVINELKSERSDRNERLRRYQPQGVQSIDDYNRLALKQGLEPMPRLLVFIDEKADCGSIDAPLEELLRLSREVGIHFVVGSNRPKRDVTPSQMASLGARLVLKLDVPDDYRVAMGDAKATLAGAGDCIYWRQGRSTVRSQALFCPPAYVVKVRDAIVNSPAMENYRHLMHRPLQGVVGV